MTIMRRPQLLEMRDIDNLVLVIVGLAALVGPPGWQVFCLAVMAAYTYTCVPLRHSGSKELHRD